MTGLRVGPLWLHLSHNPGAAFSLGAHGPAWVVPILAGLIVAGVVVYAWRAAPENDEHHRRHRR